MKLLSSLFFLLAVFLIISPSPVLAEPIEIWRSSGSNFTSNTKEYIKIVEDSPMDLTTFSTAILLNHFNGVIYGIFGPGDVNIGGSVKGVKESGQLNNTSVIQVASNSITSIVTRPPASSIEYLADLGSRLKLTSPAYAQETGAGYAGLGGIMSLWKTFRNIAYACFIIIFTVVGFMIMFRTKLNPQTAVNLQLALPKLIITLILITFSYAIAGFILDLIYFFIYLSVNTLSSDPNLQASNFFSENIFDFFRNFKPGEIAQKFGENFQEFAINIFGDSTFAQTTVGNKLTGAIVQLIVGVAIVFSLFKLLFQLIIAYVNIIIQVIFSPIMLLFNALPNANTFNSWIKNLIANAAAFPAVVILILIGTLILDSPTTDNSSLFTPPLINFVGGATNITHIIGLGIILMLPQVVKMIQEALKAKPAIPAGQAALAGIGQAAAVFPGSIISSWRESRAQRRQATYQAQELGKYMGTKTVT